MLSSDSSFGENGESRTLLGDNGPSLSNFVDYVEHGVSADHDPNKVQTEESKRARSKLVKATMICFVFMLVEIVGGYLAGSLAIMTDAAHLLSDVAGFMVSLFALYLGERKATSTLTFGFKRAEIIGAILSVMLIWFLTGILIWEAILRTKGIVNNTRDSVVDGKIMFIVATFGLLANMTLLFVLGHDHAHGLGGGHGHSHGEEDVEHGHAHSVEEDHGHSHGKKKAANINVSAAYVHAIGDLIQSAGVCVAGGLIWAMPGESHRMVQLADPLATFLFSILVLYSTYEIMSTSVNVLMEGVPAGINPRVIAQALADIPNVTGVHHLHIWSITIGSPSLSVHLVVKRGVDMESILTRAQHVLREHNIFHSTVQCESSEKEVCSDNECEGTPCNAYAIKCHDNGNCFDDFRIDSSSPSSRHTSYGAIAPTKKKSSSKKHEVRQSDSHGHSHNSQAHGHSHNSQAHGHSHNSQAHGHSH